MRLRIAAMLMASTVSVHAQQQDQSKLVPWLKQQREAALDAAAQCFSAATDLQNKLTDAEKRLVEIAKDNNGESSPRQ